MALRAYYGYGRYLVELMRLPTDTPEERAAMVPDLDVVEFKRLWRESPNGGGMIFVVGHVGSNDAVAAAIARHEMPISVLADDSAFPELFELLRSQREAWGVRIIGWRNLRAIFGVLRRREMLGLLVDWGYRADGIPVKLFGAVDGVARGSGDAGRQDRLPHPAHHDPAPARRDVPRDVARSDRPRIGRPGRAPARDPVDRRRARHHRRRGAGPVVQLQADLAGHAGGGRRPRAPRDPDAGRHRRSGTGAGVRLTVRAVRSWISVRLLLIASWLACRLPERLLVPLAEFAGDLWYRATPDRAAQARRNLRRVAGDLARRGRGTPGVRAAATDPRALERLVRLAYRHAARYYLEVVRTPGLRPGDVDERMDIETPDLVADAFTPGRASIFVGLHFGAIELPAILLASRVGGAVAPMETIDDPRLQDWFVRTRGAVGVRIVGLREARRELQAALRTGTSVGLVGDRDLTGGGVLTELFGAPAQLPLGPAMLGVESGAPLFVMGVRRTGIGRYKGRLELVTTPTDGSRRERVTTTMAGIARAFERIVEDAPEQWWAVFFPIWPDLEAEAAAAAGAPVAPEAPSPEARTT